MVNVVWHVKKKAWSPCQSWELVGPVTYNLLCVALGGQFKVLSLNCLILNIL